jgi:hypothetical protein
MTFVRTIRPTLEPYVIDWKGSTVSESTEAALPRLSVLVGEWTTESTHPSLPGTVVYGQATFKWLEGKKFLIWRERCRHGRRRRGRAHDPNKRD